MQFIYPNVLWALTALALPIIIHLFNFRKYTTVYFSNVDFLKNIQKESKSKSTLKNLLILLLRCLAIAFLVLAFAKPYIPEGEQEKIVEQPYVIVYIDNSFSMDADGKYGILLESAKLKARELAALLPRNTKYLLLTNEFTTMHQRYVGSDQFVEWVSQIKSTHIVRNLNDILSKALVLKPSDTSLVQKCYIISDFQENMLHDFNFFDESSLKLIALKVLGNPVGNLYIDSIWLESPGHYKGKEENLIVKIVNQSDQDHSDIPLTLYINDSIRSSVTFNIDANKTSQIEISFNVWQPGYVFAHVELTDYPITFDNKMYFSFKIIDKKKILIINGFEVEQYFEALFSNDENVISNSVNEQEIPYNNFGDYGVVILNQIENLSSGLVNELINFTKKGGSVVFIPSDEGNVESYNMLAGKIGFNYSKPVEQEGIISNIDFKHSLFDETIESELNEARFPEYKYYFPIQVNNNSMVDKLFFTETNDALFIRKQVDKGEFFASALTFSEENTDLALHPLFVPLIYNIALYSSKPSELYYWIRPETISKTKALSKSNAPVLINSETGIKLMPKYNLVNNYAYLYPEIDKLEAGHYKVTFGEDQFGGVSYNYDRVESQMKFYNTNDIKEILNTTNNKVETFELGENKLEKAMVVDSMGENFSGLFLWLLAIVLFAEMFVLRLLK